RLDGRPVLSVVVLNGAVLAGEPDVVRRGSPDAEIDEVVAAGAGPGLAVPVVDRLASADHPDVVGAASPYGGRGVGEQVARRLPTQDVEGRTAGDPGVTGGAPDASRGGERGVDILGGGPGGAVPARELRGEVDDAAVVGERPEVVRAGGPEHVNVGAGVGV